MNTKNIAVVVFTPASTEIDRQAAIDSVNGIVVGGIPISNEGYYFVQVADSGTGLQLQSAIDKLTSLPQVDNASLDYRLGARAYLRPQDGSGWLKTDWKTSPDSASGHNWAFEAVSAPLAWGCSTGDLATKIAVLDVGFDSTEVARNTGAGSSLFGAQSTDAVRHGTTVSNLIAARGNDSVGMAGMMWNSNLQLSTFNTPELTGAQIASAVLAAANAGVPVINISFYVPWRALSAAEPTKLAYRPWQYPDSTRKLSRQLVHSMMPGLRLARQSGHMPLIVFAAGNDSLDASFGFPAIRDSFPTNVLTVGASTITSQAAGFSNSGSYVDVYAPGDNVYSYAPAGGVLSIQSVSGTSFAAPLVSGLAGLILNLNPTLSASDIQSIIKSGATGGAPSGKPIINAYTSLRLAAQGHGAGICGNRIWTDGRDIRVERSSGSSEVIATLPVGDTAYSAQVEHLNRMYVWGTANGHLIKFSGGAWVDSIGDYSGNDILGGTDQSMGRSSHDGDSTVSAGASSGSADDTPGWRVTIDLPDGSEKNLGVVSRPMPGPSLACVEKVDGSCIHTIDLSVLRSGNGMETSLQEPAVAYSPKGDEVFIAVPVFSNNVVSSWSDCIGSTQPGVDLCLTAAIDRVSDSTVVTAIKISNGAQTRLWSVPSKRVASLGASEGDALDFVSRSLTIHNTFLWTYGRGPSSNATSATACSTDFRRRDGSNAESKVLAPGTPCSVYYGWSGSGTIAPNKLVPHARLTSHR